jgi:hypothetical protein
MGRGKLSEEEIRILKKNPYVIDVNERGISYSEEFMFLFIREYVQGRKPTDIFRSAGFDTKILGSKRIERACARWKESYEAGTLGRRSSKRKTARSMNASAIGDAHAGDAAGAGRVRASENHGYIYADHADECANRAGASANHAVESVKFTEASVSHASASAKRTEASANHADAFENRVDADGSHAEAAADFTAETAAGSAPIVGSKLIETAYETYAKSDSDREAARHHAMEKLRESTLEVCREQAKKIKHLTAENLLIKAILKELTAALTDKESIEPTAAGITRTAAGNITEAATSGANAPGDNANSAADNSALAFDDAKRPLAGMKSTPDDAKTPSVNMEVPAGRANTDQTEIPEFGTAKLGAETLCRIIEEIAEQEEFSGCVSTLCRTAGISRNTYYSYCRSK